MIVELFSSTLPADVLYGENSLPRVDGEPVRASKAAATIHAPQSGGRHQPVRVVDKLRRAEPHALVAKRPMANPPSAIDERAASPRSRPLLATCPSCSPAGRAGRAHPDAGEAARGMAIPRRHPGMESLVRCWRDASSRMESAFPGVENEMQGVTAGNGSNGKPYRGVYCLTES